MNDLLTLPGIFALPVIDPAAADIVSCAILSWLATTAGNDQVSGQQHAEANPEDPTPHRVIF